MTDNLVLANQDGPVLVLTLNRPERLNAITPALVDELCGRLESAQDDASLSAIILTGAGRSFCAGDDLHDASSHSADLAAQQHFVEQLQQVTRLIMLGRLPVIAAVRGWAVGGGLEWVFNADFVVAGESARGFFPEMSLGLFPTGAITSILPRIVGTARARQLLMLGEHVSAEQLHEWGVARPIVADDDIVTEAVSLGKAIAGLPDRSVGDLRKALRQINQVEIDLALSLETKATISAFMDPQTPARLAERAPR